MMLPQPDAVPTVALIHPGFDHVSSPARQRCLRFIRCLSARSFRVVVITSGTTSGVTPAPWGEVVRVARFARFCRGGHGPSGACVQGGAPQRSPRVWHWLHFRFVYPDMNVFWSLAAAFSGLVRGRVRGARWVISTSPPESAHIGGKLLAWRIGAQWMLDMRDGWLDEPLRRWILESALRRRVEGWIEGFLLPRAALVCVTSEGWRDLLLSRHPRLQPKVHVLANAVPSARIPAETGRLHQGGLQIVYAGGIGSSRHTSDIMQYAKGLQKLARATEGPVKFLFVGRISPAERRELSGMIPKGNDHVHLEFAPAVPHERIMEILSHADGALLLNHSYAAIPSKLFDYLAVGIPIYAILLPAQSAAMRLCDDLPQVFLHDPSLHDAKVETAFFTAMRRHERYACPHRFTEQAHGDVLAALLQGISASLQASG